MLIRKVVTSGLMVLMAIAGANAQVKSQTRQHKNYSVSKKYANNIKVEEQVSKFQDYSEMENVHPSDALYSSDWNNMNLNPYKMEIPDSFKIYVSDFQAPVINRVTSEYGPRWGRFHAGIDLALTVGDSVRAAFDGEVRISHKFNKNGYGWYVVIRHDNGLETLYGHLKKPLVEDNQHVNAGDVIGLGGNTGRSTGPHLHFETRFLGMPMNPRNIIDFDESVIIDDTYVISKDSSFVEWNDFHANYVRTKGGKYVKRRSAGKGKKQMAFMKNGASAVRPSSNGYHRVKNGDTLYGIARANNTTVANICKMNKMSESSTLKLGTVIRVR